MAIPTLPSKTSLFASVLLNNNICRRGGVECVCVCVQGGINDTCYDSVCVCVYFPFILGIKTGFLIHLLSAVRALIFLARRIQPFLSLVSTVTSNFVY